MDRSPDEHATLFAQAHATRLRHVGPEVHVRALVECGNHCVRTCHYCGLRGGNRAMARFRLEADEVLTCARRAADAGFGTLVLQAGEDPELSADFVVDLTRRIVGELGLAVTLSLGERPAEELRAFRRAGATRYLLRFETSNDALYRRVHPAPAGAPHRLALLEVLRALDFQVGTGFLVGLPGSTWDDFERDVRLTSELDPDMIGLGPFVADPDTPLGEAPPSEVPADALTTHVAIARLRLACPDAHIVASTALAVVGGERARDLALLRGANVFMPNLSPPRARAAYRIYPGKEAAEPFGSMAALAARVERLGLTLGRGPGTSPRYLRRQAPGGPACSPRSTS